MEVHTFLLRRGTVSLMALRSAYTYLNALQVQKRYIEYDDISQGLLLGANLDNIEIIAHNVLIYESAIASVQYPDGPRRMILQVDLEGESSFLKRILRFLNFITSGGIFPSLDNFIRDYERYFSSIRSNRMPSIKLAPGPNRVQKNNSSSNSTNYNKALLKNLPKESLPSTEVAQILAQKDDFEICEQGIRFLAEIRRGGMDVLFPQIKHDKVLSIIFTVFTLVKITAHKELIDLVMAIKDCGSISNLECVSKTKIRGVIALLKLATIIETHGGSNEKVPVTLTLSTSIDSIETLREQHDEFLGNFGTNQPVLWREQMYHEKLIWGNNFATRRDRLKEMELFIPKLLDSLPMRHVIESIPKGRIDDIYVTRTEALENDSLYQSYSFNLSEDEKDHPNRVFSLSTFNSDSVSPSSPSPPITIPIVINSSSISSSSSSSTSCPTSPTHPSYNVKESSDSYNVKNSSDSYGDIVRQQSTSVSSYLSSMTDSYASTSKDEWSTDSINVNTPTKSPYPVLLVRPEYRTPLSNILPHGDCGTPATAFLHSSTSTTTTSIASASASTSASALLRSSIFSPFSFDQYHPVSSLSSPTSEQDYLFPVRNTTTSTYTSPSQSYTPSMSFQGHNERIVEENTNMGIGMNMEMGAKLNVWNDIGKIGGNIGNIRENASTHMTRSYSLDSSNRSNSGSMFHDYYHIPPPPLQASSFLLAREQERENWQGENRTQREIEIETEAVPEAKSNFSWHNQIYNDSPYSGIMNLRDMEVNQREQNILKEQKQHVSSLSAIGRRKTIHNPQPFSSYQTQHDIQQVEQYQQQQHRQLQSRDIYHLNQSIHNALPVHENLDDELPPQLNQLNYKHNVPADEKLHTQSFHYQQHQKLRDSRQSISSLPSPYQSDIGYRGSYLPSHSIYSENIVPHPLPFSVSPSLDLIRDSPIPFPSVTLNTPETGAGTGVKHNPIPLSQAVSNTSSVSSISSFSSFSFSACSPFSFPAPFLHTVGIEGSRSTRSPETHGQQTEGHQFPLTHGQQTRGHSNSPKRVTFEDN